VLCSQTCATTLSGGTSPRRSARCRARAASRCAAASILTRALNRHFDQSAQPPLRLTAVACGGRARLRGADLRARARRADARRRGEVYAYAINPLAGVGGDGARDARWAHAMRANAAALVGLHGESDVDAAARIASDRCHVLVDAMGYTRGTRPP
jgi:hypothetical protein